MAAVAAKMPAQHSPAAILANRLFTTMKDALDPEQFDALASGLAAIAAKIPAPESGPLASQLINAITDAKQFKIIDKGAPDDDVNRFRAIGPILAALVKITPEAEAETYASQLFSAIKMPLDAGQFQALSHGLAEVTAKMTQPQADSFAGQLIKAMKGAKDANQFHAFGQGVAGAAKPMSAQQTQALTQQYIAAINEQKNRQSYIRLDSLAKGLAELAAKAPKEQASTLTEQLIAAVRASENRMQTTAFGPGLAKAAANIPAAQTVTEAAFITSLFKDANDTQLKVFARALEAMAKNLPEDQALATADPIIAAIKDPGASPQDEQDRSKIKILGKAL
jgi:hypothetical protein